MTKNNEITVLPSSKDLFQSTLAIDIGGTNIKMMVLDLKGSPLTEYISALTPRPATVTAVCDLIDAMIKILEEFLSKAALKKYGVSIWRKNLKDAISLWQRTFNYDKLYLGGGNAQKINFKLPDSVKISDNIEGILGGIKLWK